MWNKSSFYHTLSVAAHQGATLSKFEFAAVAYRDFTGAKLNILPLERQRFANSHPRFVQQIDQEVIAGIGARIQHRLHFLWSQGFGGSFRLGQLNFLDVL